MEYSNGGAWMQIEPKGLFLHFVSILIIYKYNTLEALPPAEKGANPYSHTQKWIVIILFYYKILKKTIDPNLDTLPIIRPTIHETWPPCMYDWLHQMMSCWRQEEDDHSQKQNVVYVVSDLKKKHLTGWFFAIDLSIMFE